MSNGSSRSRRLVLRIAGGGVCGALAGCVGGRGDSDGGDDDSTATSSPTQTPNATATTAQQTDEPDSTETQAEFSTNGDDSTPIDSPVKSLVISDSDLPGDGWSEAVSEEESVTDGSAWQVGFERVTDETQENIGGRVWVYDEISDAKRQFDRVSYEGTIGQSPEESRQLEIGVESDWYFGTLDDSVWYSNQIRVRDANVVGYLSWTQVNESEGFSPVGLPEIGDVAVTMHTKWR